MKTKKQRFSLYFDVISAGVFGDNQTKQRKIDLISCKISQLIHLEITRGLQNLLMRVECGPRNRAWAAL